MFKYFHMKALDRLLQSVIIIDGINRKEQPDHSTGLPPAQPEKFRKDDTMKKLTALLLSLALVLGLAACGSTTPEVHKDDPQTPAETPIQDPAAPEEPQTGKTLVVYYSASGHTRQVAQAIAQAAELNKGV
jgi:hypothetical protein